MIYVLTERL